MNPRLSLKESLNPWERPFPKTHGTPLVPWNKWCSAWYLGPSDLQPDGNRSTLGVIHRAESGLSWHCQELIFLLFHAIHRLPACFLDSRVCRSGVWKGWGRADVRNAAGHEGLVVKTLSKDTHTHSDRSFAPPQQGRGLPHSLL